MFWTSGIGSAGTLGGGVLVDRSYVDGVGSGASVRTASFWGSPWARVVGFRLAVVPVPAGSVPGRSDWRS